MAQMEVCGSGVQQVFGAFSKEEVDALCSQFQVADTNNDGLIDAAELRTELQKQFPTADPAVIDRLQQALMASGDANRDGKLDLKEFKLMIIRRQTEIFDDEWSARTTPEDDSLHVGPTNGGGDRHAP
jgi:hypothetical protein